VETRRDLGDYAYLDRRSAPVPAPAPTLAPRLHNKRNRLNRLAMDALN
jgi:hypothetical protein